MTRGLGATCQLLVRSVFQFLGCYERSEQAKCNTGEVYSGDEGAWDTHIWLRRMAGECDASTEDWLS